MNRVGNYRGTVHVKGGCCYNGRIPEQVSVVGATNCEDLPSDDTPEYINADELVQAVEPMMADMPSTYREGGGNSDDDDDSIILNEVDGNEDSRMQRNNRRFLH